MLDRAGGPIGQMEILQVVYVLKKKDKRLDIDVAEACGKAADQNVR